MMTILLINTAMGWEVQTTEGGAEYHWPTMPLDYVWVRDEAPQLTDLRGTIDAAFASWTEVPDAEITVAPRDRLGAVGQVNLDDDHVVFFETEWPIGNEALAVATTWADEEGRVVSFDIRVNAHANWSTHGDAQAFDLQAAMTHEVGHVLGLEHSGIADATMYAAHDLGEGWRQDLHDDDQAAVQYLYDAGLNAASGAGCAAIPTHRGPGSGHLLLGLLPLTLLLRRRS